MNRSYLDRLLAKPSILSRFAWVLLGLYSLIALYLLPTVILSSFKTKQDLIRNPMGPPHSFTLDNYATILGKDGFLIYLKNSVLLTALSLLCLIFVASMTAYGLARYRFRGRKFLQTYFLLGMMFPIQLGILPIFIIIRSLGLANNFLGMALLYSANISLPVFIFARFFQGLPGAVYESAVIDGAGEFTIYARIMMPISKPVLATVGIMDFVIIWNDFYLPLVFLTKKSVRTLTLGIYSYMNNFLANWHLVFAAVTIALIPVLVAFFLFSNQLVAGLTAGSVKE
jgi:raffinose/stachyose/melibiose transport system permease protein